MRNILIIAPHADDEILGVGGTINFHIKNNDHVFICIITAPYTPEWTESFVNKRKQEIHEVHKYLGIHNTIQLNFPAAKLDQIPRIDIHSAIKSIVDQVKPSEVYIPHYGDLHHDHRVVFESSLVALRPFQSFVRRILSYETLSETEWGMQSSPFIPTVYIDISSFLDNKINAMKLYKSELRKFPHPRSIQCIKYLAMKRGSEVYVDAAEAFQLIRERII